MAVKRRFNLVACAILAAAAAAPAFLADAKAGTWMTLCDQNKSVSAGTSEWAKGLALRVAIVPDGTINYGFEPGLSCNEASPGCLDMDSGLAMQSASLPLPSGDGATCYGGCVPLKRQAPGVSGCCQNRRFDGHTNADGGEKAPLCAYSVEQGKKALLATFTVSGSGSLKEEKGFKT